MIDRIINFLFKKTKMTQDIISNPMNDTHDRDVDIDIDNNCSEKEDNKADINENLILLAIN